jgi:hypothetical protein
MPCRPVAPLGPVAPLAPGDPVSLSVTSSEAGCDVPALSLLSKLNDMVPAPEGTSRMPLFTTDPSTQSITKEVRSIARYWFF